MASVYQKRGRWYIAWGPRGPDRKAKPLGDEYQTRAQALAYKRLFEAEEIRSGAPRPVGLVTFADAWADFALSGARTWSSGTRVYYRTHGANFARLLRTERPLSAFGPDALERYTDKRAAETSAATANKELGTLRTFWRWAIRRRMATINPAEAVDDLPEERAEREPASPDVLACALRVLRGRIGSGRGDGAHGARTFAAALRIAWHTGMRLGELCRLRPEDVDFRERSYLVRATRVKGGDRLCPIPRAIERLLRRLAERGGPFLLTSRDGVTSAYSTLRQARDDFAVRYPALKLAGFHSLRHALATRAADVIEDSARRDLLGHSGEVTTRGYTHRALEAKRAAMEEVERARRSHPPSA